MSKSATILGLVAIASAGAPAAYGSSAPAYAASSAPAYDPSSSVYAAPSSSWGAVSSAPAYYSSSSYDPSYSSAPAYPSASWSSSVVYSAVPSSSYSVVPSSTPTPVCWSTCFAAAGISSESDLCGNTQVDECIHDGCSCEESWAYWQWYDSYCPVASSTDPVYPASSTIYTSYSATPSAPVDTCWTDCFAEYDVTSEAELCGDDEVSACIHETCSSALDKAYWDWYNGFCAAASTTVYTYTTYYTPTATPYNPYTTTYYETSTLAWTPVETSPVTTLPAPPASPIAPYTTYPAVTSAWAAPTGYAAPTATGAAPSASAWAPVPATGAGAVTKPGMLFAAAMAVAALF